MTRGRRRFGLRARATIAFGIMGLAVAASMGLLTWLVARSYLVDQRERAAMRQAYANARLTRSALRVETVDVADFLTGLGGSGGSTQVIRHRDDWFAGSLSLGREALPAELQQVVAEGGVARQRFTGPDDELRLGVGIALPAVDGAYFEIYTLDSLVDALSVVRGSLAAGAAVTSLAAAAVGWTVAGRVLRPLTPVTATARRIAGGELSARLDSDVDPDLTPLTTAFNSMAGALHERIENEARFASDVSHELRSPLAVLSASTEIIDRRRDQLPDTVASAFDVLKSRLSAFEILVLDLLEISRFDNNVAKLDPESIRLELLLRQVAMTLAPMAGLVIDDDVPEIVVADRRRLVQALHNVCINASSYAGGATGISVSVTNGRLQIDVDDDGPGVAPSERRAIFERFARGTAGQRAGSSSGTGLGLSLVVEHLKLHGGSVEVHDAPGGGARFRLTIPLRDL